MSLCAYEKALARHTAYWKRQNHGAPLMCITAPKYDYKAALPAYDGTLRQRWLDPAYQVLAERARIQATHYVGDAYPFVAPNLGPDIFAAYFGIDLAFGETTSWAINHLKSLEDIQCDALDEDNFWWQQTLALTQAFLEDSRGDYLVGITDLHPGMDALVSLRGAEEICFDAVEEPEMVAALALRLFDRMREAYTRLAGLLGEYQKGSTNWMGVYHPEGWYVTSCDWMGMVSGEMFDAFVRPELAQEAAFLPHTIFHLDGPGALRHLDRLLAMENIAGIQWVYGAGQPTAAHWIEVLRRIQDAGKCVHVEIVAADLPVLLEKHAPEGLALRMVCDTPEEADHLVRLAGVD